MPALLLGQNRRSTARTRADGGLNGEGRAPGRSVLPGRRGGSRGRSPGGIAESGRGRSGPGQARLLVAPDDPALCWLGHDPGPGGTVERRLRRVLLAEEGRSVRRRDQRWPDHRSEGRRRQGFSRGQVLPVAGATGLPGALEEVSAPRVYRAVEA